MGVPTAIALQEAKVVASALLQGFICIAPVIEEPKFWDVTVITPVPTVATEATYLLVEEADSQPHGFVALAAGNTVVVWTASVIEVRQVEAAKIISETFALTV